MVGLNLASSMTTPEPTSTKPPLPPTSETPMTPPVPAPRLKLEKEVSRTDKSRSKPKAPPRPPPPPPPPVSLEQLPPHEFDFALTPRSTPPSLIDGACFLIANRFFMFTFWRARLLERSVRNKIRRFHLLVDTWRITESTRITCSLLRFIFLSLIHCN